MVVWQQHPVFIPLDRVIRIADHTAVNEGVTTGHGCDVPHGPNTGRTCKGEEREQERERERRKSIAKRGMEGKRRGFKGEQESHRGRKMEKSCFGRIFGVKEGEKWAEEKARASNGEGGGLECPWSSQQTLWCKKCVYLKFQCVLYCIHHYV